jgi:hypothetical protein
MLFQVSTKKGVFRVTLLVCQAVAVAVLGWKKLGKALFVPLLVSSLGGGAVPPLGGVGAYPVLMSSCILQFHKLRFMKFLWFLLTLYLRHSVKQCGETRYGWRLKMFFEQILRY